MANCVDSRKRRQPLEVLGEYGLQLNDEHYQSYAIPSKRRKISTGSSVQKVEEEPQLPIYEAIIQSHNDTAFLQNELYKCVDEKVQREKEVSELKQDLALTKSTANQHAAEYQTTIEDLQQQVRNVESIRKQDLETHQAQIKEAQQVVLSLREEHNGLKAEYAKATQKYEETIRSKDDLNCGLEMDIRELRDELQHERKTVRSPNALPSPPEDADDEDQASAADSDLEIQQTIPGGDLDEDIAYPGCLEMNDQSPTVEQSLKIDLDDFNVATTDLDLEIDQTRPKASAVRLDGRGKQPDGIVRSRLAEEPSFHTMDYHAGSEALSQLETEQKQPVRRPKNKNQSQGRLSRSSSSRSSKRKRAAILGASKASGNASELESGMERLGSLGEEKQKKTVKSRKAMKARDYICDLEVPPILKEYEHLYGKFLIDVHWQQKVKQAMKEGWRDVKARARSLVQEIIEDEVQTVQAAIQADEQERMIRREAEQFEDARVNYETGEYRKLELGAQYWDFNKVEMRYYVDRGQQPPLEMVMEASDFDHELGGFILPIERKLKTCTDKAKYAHKCVIAMMPELQLQAASSFLKANEAASFKERSFPDGMPFATTPQEKEDPKLWASLVEYLRRSDQFQKAAKWWADGEPSFGNSCWPPAFHDREKVYQCGVFQSEEEQDHYEQAQYGKLDSAAQAKLNDSVVAKALEVFDGSRETSTDELIQALNGATVKSERVRKKLPMDKKSDD